MQKDKIIINPDFENWVNNNRELLRKYKGNWVAFTEEEGLVASKKTLQETQEEALRVTSFRTVYYFVDPYIYEGLRFPSISIMPVKSLSEGLVNGF